jgi:hypothetical protein
VPHGGARPGAGRKKGAVTLSKEAARELVRERVIARLGPMLDAQIANAEGLKYLVTRDKKTGKFIRVTEAMARTKQGDNEEHVEVWEKDPSVQAFTDLLNRAIDKPAEHVDVTVTKLADAPDEELVARVTALQMKLLKG